MFVALVVVDVSGENYEAGVDVGLPVFQKFSRVLSPAAGRVAFSEHAGAKSLCRADDAS